MNGISFLTIALGLLFGLADVMDASTIPSSWALVNGVAPAGGFTVDTSNRLESLAFYNTIYLASEGAETRIGWTSSFTGNCVAGTTSSVFREDVRRRVNYFRVLAGLPSVTFDAENASQSPAGSPQVAAGSTKHSCAQASAYMNGFSTVFYDNYVLSHNPSSASSACWTARAWNGSQHSNLTVGYFGPKAMDIYMADDDLNDDASNNVNVGHRRWILYSRSRDMSTGDVPPGSYTDASGTYPALPANALYVTGIANTAENSPKQFVTWPPKGFIPAPLKPLRWSISFPGATFPTSATAITLLGPQGSAIPVTVLSSNSQGIGDNTLVFQPSATTLLPTGDSTFTVTVSGISGNGAPSTYSWQTTFFDPDQPGITQTISGPLTPPVAGAMYQFTTPPLVESYQITAAQTALPANWMENADNATNITAQKTGTYPLLQGPGTLKGLTFTPRSGSASFHLCFPLDSSEPDYLPHAQAFSLNDEFIPTAGSALTFYEHFRYLFKNNELKAELSTDGGNQWTAIYTRGGAYTYSAGASYSSAGWDPGWSQRSVSLSPWAGKPVRLRFILRPGSISFDGPDINHGCYIDDISLSNVIRLSTSLPQTVTSSSFKFDVNLTGTPPEAGKPYLLRIRPIIGSRVMGYTGSFIAVPRPPTGFESTFPLLAALPDLDADGDGISNLIEYALGQNPQDSSTAALPQAVLSANGLTMSFNIPPAITDILYSAERTRNFINWEPLPNTGTPTAPIFHIPLTPGENWYMRLRMTQYP